MTKDLALRIKLGAKAIASEIANAVTDLIVPIISIVGVVVVLLPIPKKYKLMYKIAEEFIKQIGRTALDITNEIDKWK